LIFTNNYDSIYQQIESFLCELARLLEQKILKTRRILMSSTLSSDIDNASVNVAQPEQSEPCDDSDDSPELRASVARLVLTAATRRYNIAMRAMEVLDYSTKTGDLSPFFGEVDALLRFASEAHDAFERLRMVAVRGQATANCAKQASRRELKRIKKARRLHRTDGYIETLLAELAALRGYTAALEKIVADISLSGDAERQRVIDARKRLEHDAAASHCEGDDGVGAQCRLRAR
jgi:hypothetical protein